MRSLPLILALFPAIAAAGANPADGADSVEISGRVEVPLYRAARTSGMPAMWVEAPHADPDAKDHERTQWALARISLASDPSRISHSYAAKIGAKVKKTKHHGREVEIAVVPELRLDGKVVLRDLVVEVDDSFGADVLIGFAALPEIGTAMLGSKGVVVMVPAADAPALLAEVGTPVDAIRFDETKTWWHGTKTWEGNSVTLLVPGHAGIPAEGGYVRLYTNRSDVTTRVAFEGMRTFEGLPETTAQPVVAGQTLPSVWVGSNSGIDHPQDLWIGSVGWPALATSDIAVDPANVRVALRVNPSYIAVDPTERLLAARKEEFDHAIGDIEAPATAPTDDGHGLAAEPRLVPVSRYAGALVELGHAADAVSLWSENIAGANDDCSAYLAYGQALMAVGKANEAIPQFEKAGGLWDRWWDASWQDRARMSAGKIQDTDDLAVPQDNACFEAWGWAAAAKLATTDYAGVAALYEGHADLDAVLPRAQGIALLAKHDEAANGPLRRALNSGDQSPAVRSALALAHTGGEQVVIDRQAAEILPTADKAGFVALLPVVEAARAAHGDAGAQALTAQLAGDDPLAVQAALLAVIEDKFAGNSDAVERGLAAAESRFTAYEARHPNDPITAGYKAVLQALKGDVAGANATLAAAEQAWGQSGDLSSARALVAQIGGDGPLKDAALLQVRMFAPLSPVGQLTLK